jgi:hypothetical protein
MRLVPKASSVATIPRACGLDVTPDVDLFADQHRSQGHALLFDDILIPAGCLVNDMTISLDPVDERDQLEFFHAQLRRLFPLVRNGRGASPALRAAALRWSSHRIEDQGPEPVIALAWTSEV